MASPDITSLNSTHPLYPACMFLFAEFEDKLHDTVLCHRDWTAFLADQLAEREKASYEEAFEMVYWLIEWLRLEAERLVKHL